MQFARLDLLVVLSRSRRPTLYVVRFVAGRGCLVREKVQTFVVVVVAVVAIRIAAGVGVVVATGFAAGADVVAIRSAVGNAVPPTRLTAAEGLVGTFLHCSEEGPADSPTESILVAAVADIVDIADTDILEIAVE